MNRSQIAYYTRSSAKDIEIVGTFQKSDTREALVKNNDTGKVLHVVSRENEDGRIVIKVVTDKKAKDSFLESCATTKSVWKDAELLLGERGRKPAAEGDAPKPKKASAKKGKKTAPKKGKKGAEVDPLA